jgi:hypothetical protein
MNASTQTISVVALRLVTELHSLLLAHGERNWIRGVSHVGALLQDNTVMALVADVLAEQHFYSLPHRLIFGAVAALLLARQTADVVTVFERLQTAQP